VSLYSQDTICLSKDRLARVADTLSHYKSFTRLFYQCDSLLALKSELNTVQGQKLVQKDIQIKVLNNSFAECEYLRSGFEASASEYKQSFEASEKRLHRAKKARKGWMTTAFVGITATVVTTTILMIKP
jgi:hypothetical protein